MLHLQKMFFLTVFLLFIVISNTKYSWYDLHLLNTTEALCLDGSPGSYYVSREGDGKNVLIFFMGGGWCGVGFDVQTLEDCYQRTTLPLGSSKYYPSPLKQTLLGILTTDKRNNFKNWKKIIINYCDGAGHQGYRKQPVKYKDTNLYFRGHNITIETFDSLEQNYGLFTNAEQVVVGGVSAGALSVYFWANHVAEMVKNGKTWVFTQSGIFIDAPDFNTKKRQFRSKMQDLMNRDLSMIIKADKSIKIYFNYAQILDIDIKVKIKITTCL